LYIYFSSSMFEDLVYLHSVAYADHLNQIYHL
jgi:hypothetical protein